MKTFVRALKKSLSKRFIGIIKNVENPFVSGIDYADEMYFIGAALDPNHKLYWLHNIKDIPDGKALSSYFELK
jgi:hypothetical protein